MDFAFAWQTLLTLLPAVPLTLSWRSPQSSAA